MDIGDPELAEEMIRLLGQELKAVKAQLREQVSRNFVSSSDDPLK